MTEDVERVRQTLGDRAARRYRALTDLEQLHLAEFGGGRDA